MEVENIEVSENPILLQTFDLKQTKCFVSEITLSNKLWGAVEYKVQKS